jgi:hypothetical protein
MIALEADRRNTLELVQQVSLASRGGVSPQVFLERVCRAVAEVFAFDSVTALQFHPEAEEVSEVAVGPSPGRLCSYGLGRARPSSLSLAARAEMSGRRLRYRSPTPTVAWASYLGIDGASARRTGTRRQYLRPSALSPPLCSTTRSLATRLSNSTC